MQELRKSFVKSCDDVGKQLFTLVKREKNVAMYTRTGQGRAPRYEVFEIRVKAPTEIYGRKYPEKEHYPTKNDFGRKNAFDISGVDAEIRAEEKFTELLTLLGDQGKVYDVVAEIDEDDDESVAPVVATRRGRKANNEIGFEFPSGSFTHKEYADKHSVKPGRVWGSLTKGLKQGLIVKSGTKLVGKRETITFRLATV